jgi:alkaline phosphatase D
MPFTRRSFAQTITTASALAATTNRNADAQASGVFRHGVASGDPLINRVILWTRVSVPADEEMTVVEWAVADDAAMRRVLQRGVTSTNIGFDNTVKVDVTRLDPGRTYYYQFTAKGTASPVGRTKTLPVGSPGRLRFAVASCSNYPYGYFNAYRNIAARADLDFVTHLGDYIYEYGNRQYGDGAALGRVPQPDKEIVTLQDYRQRYAQYRSDPDLQEAHRQHPWIMVWDDHESANDSWENGAQNHTPETEGDWNTRRAESAQAWFEWLPVRENPYLGGQIYRKFQFGNLMDFVVLDTRLAGRSQQVAANSPALLDANRGLLGAEQEAWFFQELLASRNRNTRWRFVGQQVMMGQLLNPDGSPINTDQWDGYPAARARVLGHLAQNQISNVVVLTGDIHSSWGNEITGNPFAPGYVAQAVEFVCPAVTSPGIDDRAQATALQLQIGATHPHVKYVDLFRRGYLLMDVTAERAQAEWYHVRTITERTADEELGRVLFASSGETRLRVGTASTAGAGAPPAP